MPQMSSRLLVLGMSCKQTLSSQMDTTSLVKADTCFAIVDHKEGAKVVHQRLGSL